MSRITASTHSPSPRKDSRPIYAIHLLRRHAGTEDDEIRGGERLAHVPAQLERDAERLELFEALHVARGTGRGTDLIVYAVIIIAIAVISSRLSGE